MRDYGRVAPTFWTRGSGKKLRGKPIAQIVALYLFTCPASSMIGIYHMAIPTMAHETGLSIDDVERGLSEVIALDIARYDHEEELVYLPEGARYQIGESLKPGDKRVKGIESALAQFARHPFAADFARRYGAEFCLRQAPGPVAPPMSLPPDEDSPKGHAKESEGASKGLASDAETGDMPLGSQARQGKDQATQEKEQQAHTHRASAPACEDDGDGGAVLPRCTEADIAEILRSVSVLTELADDPATVTDLHSGFAMACMDAATVDLAREAIGAVVSAENLREMPPRQRRERVGRYLSNARKYTRGSDRGSSPVTVTQDMRVVLSVFSEAWEARKRRAYVQAQGDEKHAAALAEAAWEQAGRLQMRPRDIVGHWAKKYLQDADPFVANPEHPLRLLPSRLTTYGLPKKPSSGKPVPAKEPSEPFVPPPTDLMERLGQVGVVGRPERG